LIWLQLWWFSFIMHTHIINLFSKDNDNLYHMCFVIICVIISSPCCQMSKLLVLSPISRDN
jgi:hypothetical protein